MKAVILAGGHGLRMSEMTHAIPKPMALVGNEPLLWHIMKTYAHYGIDEFIVCLGYKGECIKQYFIDYAMHHSNLSIDLKNNRVEYLDSPKEPWSVTLIDTGINTPTAGRLKAIQRFIGQERFCLTYGDGLCDINISDLLKFHQQHKKIATLTAIKPHGRFGSIEQTAGHVTQFREKSSQHTAWVNGGYFVFEPQIFDHIASSNHSLETDVFSSLVVARELCSYSHHGFWHAVDTLHELKQVEALWCSGSPPWRVWD